MYDKHAPLPCLYTPTIPCKKRGYSIPSKSPQHTVLLPSESSIPCLYNFRLVGLGGKVLQGCCTPLQAAGDHYTASSILCAAMQSQHHQHPVHIQQHSHPPVSRRFGHGCWDVANGIKTPCHNPSSGPTLPLHKQYGCAVEAENFQ